MRLGRHQFFILELGDGEQAVFVTGREMDLTPLRKDLIVQAARDCCDDFQTLRYPRQVESLGVALVGVRTADEFLAVWNPFDNPYSPGGWER